MGVPLLLLASCYSKDSQTSPESDETSKSPKINSSEQQKINEDVKQIDVSYLKDQPRPQLEEVLFQAAQIDGDFYLEYSELIQTQNNSMIDSLLSSSSQPEVAMLQCKAHLLTSKLARKLNISETQNLLKVATWTIKALPNHSIIECYDLLVKLLPLDQKGLLIHNEAYTTIVIPVLETLLNQKQQWSDLQGNHPFKKFPIDEIVDTFIAALFSTQVKLLYDPRNNHETYDKSGEYFHETNELRLYKNFDSDTVLHEIVHVWQDLTNKSANFLELELEAFLIQGGQMYLEDPNTEFEPNQADIDTAIADYLAPPDPITSDSISKVKKEILLSINISLRNPKTQNQIREVIAEYKSGTLNSQQAKEKLRIILENHSVTGTVDALSFEAAKNEFNPDSIKTVRQQLVRTYNRHIVLEQFQAIIVVYNKIKSNHPDSNAFKIKANELFNKFLEVRREVGIQPGEIPGKVICNYHFAKVYQLAIIDRPEDALKYYRDNIVPLLESNQYLLDMNEKEALEILKRD